MQFKKLLVKIFDCLDFTVQFNVVAVTQFGMQISSHTSKEKSPKICRCIWGVWRKYFRYLDHLMVSHQKDLHKLLTLLFMCVCCGAKWYWYRRKQTKQKKRNYKKDKRQLDERFESFGCSLFSSCWYPLLNLTNWINGWRSIEVQGFALSPLIFPVLGNLPKFSSLFFLDF